MAENPSPDKSALRQAFSDYERQIAIQKYQVGCILGIVFMPAGVSLDYFVYPHETIYFLKLRIICSLLLGGVWLLLRTPLGSRYYRSLGLIEVALPLFFISRMIYITDGASSTYYAGLNLVLMGAGIVLRWTVGDSIAVLLLALGMYLTATLVHGVIGAKAQGLFFNNIYFLVVTGIFIIAGNYIFNIVRFREFELRFELDHSRKLLEDSNRKLVEMDEVKSRFFANISHELRTPLTLLISPIESLRRTSLAESDPEIAETLQNMNANGMRLLKLINDLLDLVRLESGKMQVKKESIVVEDFFRGLAGAVRKVSEDKHVQLGVSLQVDRPIILADRDKLEKITLNLLFNAIKFTSAGGRVDLKAHTQDLNFILEIADSGMGISEQNLPFVFDRFWQADTSSQRKYQGAGIGLALVKELVEVQGGTVSVLSEVGKGTRMRVILPQPEIIETTVEVSGPEPSSAPIASVAPKEDEWLANLYRRAELFPSMTMLKDSMRPLALPDSRDRPTILVADDEPDMLRFLKTQLSPHFQVMEAVDGNQAIEMASQFLPDIIISDMMMPEKDGLEVCRELRKRTPTQGIPIILLTARADEETKLAALDAGVSDFLTKPFSTTELHVRLRNLVQGHQSQRKLSRQNQILEGTLEQLKETESQLVHSEKLASLGRMSAGIIHEINNPLNYAKTGLYSLRRKSKFLAEAEKPEFEEILNDVEDGINRVRNIVTDLRSFTHPNTERFESVEMEKVVSAALRFTSHEWKDKVTIDLDIKPGFAVWGNEHQLVQVVLNLLQNSLDALRRKNFTSDQPRVRIESQTDDRCAALVIRDNGEGIAAGNLSKIFDPFFTTKDVGEGMGLGLSICYRILREHQGRIQVRSDPGQFCEFRLEFPLKFENADLETRPEMMAG